MVLRALVLVALALVAPACKSSGSEPPSGEASKPAPGGAEAQTPPDGATPATQPGVPCGEETCAPEEQCIEYFGIAGPQGPRFQTCGIPCPDGKCPEGKKCVTVADGPGPVCE